MAVETVKLEAVTHSSDDFLKFLNNRELSLGLELKIKSVEDFDGSMVVSYGNRKSETLSQVVTVRLLVVKVKKH